MHFCLTLFIASALQNILCMYVLPMLSVCLSHKLNFLCVDFCRFVDSHCLWKVFLVVCFDFWRRRKKKEERKTVYSLLGAHIFFEVR